MALRLHPLTPANAAAWDGFVQAAPAATMFHLSGWARVMEEGFAHAAHFVLAEQDGAVVGVLPLARMKTRLFGDALISTPFCVYGGPLTVTPEAEAALAGHAVDLMRRLGVPSLEFRNLKPPALDWPERPPLYATFRKPITGDAEADMKAIPRKQRAMVRKGIQNGLTSVADGDTDRLHGIYAESVRNLGTPVFSRRYFRLLAEVFGDALDVVTVLHEGEPVAAVLNFHFRDEVLPYYGGGTQAARRLAANDFMYWEVMRRAGAERGARLFDFGRSKAGTGAHDFKEHWGFTPQPLHYAYQLGPGASLPEHNPANPKYKLMIAAWRRMPLPLAKLLGPPIVRGLG
jgi:FemAB-related protein (PEP-CTERM system-associated)